MALILSCLANDPSHARRILDRLREAGWPPEHITVLHPGEMLTAPSVPEQPEVTSQAAVMGGGSAAVAAGAFGWLIGYGVLALPAALVGAALGSAAGAAMGAGAEDTDTALRTAVFAHYGPRVSGSRSAILVRAEDAHGYDLIMRIYRSQRAQDINVVGKGRLESATTF